MNFALFALWAVAGWCGNEPRPWWWWLFPHPHPDPEPWWRIGLMSAGAGIVGGWAFTQAFMPSPDPWTGVTAAASAVGAFLTSRLVGSVYGLIKSGGSPKIG